MIKGKYVAVCECNTGWARVKPTLDELLAEYGEHLKDAGVLP